MGKNYEILMKYIEDVISNPKKHCIYERLAIERWNKDMERSDIYFDEKLFDSFCLFARQFKHYKGALSGQNFEPEPWQLFIFANVIALKRAETKVRKYTYADVYVPRKNGKTYMAAILALWYLIMDGESGPEVYTAALDQEQAKICFDAAKNMAEASVFSPLVKIMNSRVKMECPGNKGVCRPLSKDTKNKDGLNISAAICDERHAWPTNEIYDVIKTGMGARTQPMLMSISTAGTDVSNPYFSDIETYKEILMGIKQKDNHFLMLFCPDPDDKWDDPLTWAKVNPNLGVSLSLNYMYNECQEAKQRGGTFLVSFKTKNLNMWVNAPDTWIPDAEVVANSAPFDRDLLQGEECYVGIDLARKTDICAVGFYFPKYNVCDWLFVVPEAKIQEQEDRVDYRRWLEQGWIVQAPGAVLDEDWFMSMLLKKLDQYKVKGIAYDPWGMWNMLDKFGRYTEYLAEFKQSVQYMSVPTKWLEAEIRQHHLNFLGNPVMRWMMGNVVIYTDPNNNIKLDKKRSRNKIDGVVAIVDAIGLWLTKSAETKKIYTTHELRSVRM